ncbi:hypothetical protein DPMN_103390 [Dreissena polymorpha]|uniref:Uncharacterized protein n=1 Tax=Dreissena polymorpha TaxID=45954 RepID=A0A9D4K2C8_DREPO|nr:hypothetical protein DPMN_103390 [Dreissena polymorpha]
MSGICMDACVVRIQAMEREKCTHLYSKRSDFRDEFSQIEELEDKQNNERKTERKALVYAGVLVLS